MTDEQLRAIITGAGGLHTVPSLAQRWGITRQTALKLTARSDFPAPIVETDKGKLYAGVTADQWRIRYLTSRE